MRRARCGGPAACGWPYRRFLLRQSGCGRPPRTPRPRRHATALAPKSCTARVGLFTDLLVGRMQTARPASCRRGLRSARSRIRLRQSTIRALLHGAGARCRDYKWNRFHVHLSRHNGLHRKWQQLKNSPAGDAQRRCGGRFVRIARARRRWPNVRAATSMLRRGGRPQRHRGSLDFGLRTTTLFIPTRRSMRTIGAFRGACGQTTTRRRPNNYGDDPC